MASPLTRTAAQHLQVDNQRLVNTNRINLECLFPLFWIRWTACDLHLCFKLDNVTNFQAIALVCLNHWTTSFAWRIVRHLHRVSCCVVLHFHRRWNFLQHKQVLYLSEYKIFYTWQKKKPDDSCSKKLSKSIWRMHTSQEVPYFTNYKTHFLLRKIASKIQVRLILEINIKMSSVWFKIPASLKNGHIFDAAGNLSLSGNIGFNWRSSAQMRRIWVAGIHKLANTVSLPPRHPKPRTLPSLCCVIAVCGASEFALKVICVIGKSTIFLLVVS